MRRAARRDENEPAIVEALEAAGYAVTKLSQEEVPDLLLSKGERWIGPAECKVGKRGWTEAQDRFRLRHRAPIPVFRSVDDVLRWISKQAKGNRS